MSQNGTSCSGDLCVYDGAHCGAYDLRGVYVCTRKKGHTGPHIACSEKEHNVKCWTDIPRVKQPAPAEV